MLTSGEFDAVDQGTVAAGGTGLRTARGVGRRRSVASCPQGRRFRFRRQERSRVIPAKVNHAAQCTPEIGTRRQRDSLRATVDCSGRVMLDVHREFSHTLLRPRQPPARRRRAEGDAVIPLPLSSCRTCDHSRATPCLQSPFPELGSFLPSLKRLSWRRCFHSPRSPRAQLSWPPKRGAPICSCLSWGAAVPSQEREASVPHRSGALWPWLSERGAAWGLGCVPPR